VVRVTATFKNDGDSLLAEAPIKAADKVAAILSLTVNGKPVSARFGQEAVVIAELKGPAQAGKKAFEEVCAACHGVALRGSDTAPPLLHAFYAPGSGHGDDVMLAAIKNGAKSHMWKFGDMPKPEDVPSGQETNIIAYIRAMQAANGLGGSAATPIDHSGHASH
jgi:mono/diheme cytochrome c family protein